MSYGFVEIYLVSPVLSLFSFACNWKNCELLFWT